MPRVRGAYELGKSLVEQLQEAGKQLDMREEDGQKYVVSSERNVRLLVKATIRALAEAGFITGAMAWTVATAEAEKRPA